MLNSRKRKWCKAVTFEYPSREGNILEVRIYPRLIRNRPEPG